MIQEEPMIARQPLSIVSFTAARLNPGDDHQG
jgi:hypothetical protein